MKKYIAFYITSLWCCVNDQPNHNDRNKVNTYAPVPSGASAAVTAQETDDTITNCDPDITKNTKKCDKLILHKKNLYFEELPDELDGFQIGLVADLHIDFETHQDLSRIFSALNKGARENKNNDNKKPLDVIFFLGDLVNYHLNEIDTDKAYLLRKFNQLSKNGVYSILGNHDYDSYEFLWAKTPEADYDKMMYNMHNKCLKWKLLNDKHDYIEHNGAFIKLIGIEHWAMCSTVKNRGSIKKAHQKRYKNIYHPELNMNIRPTDEQKKDKTFNILLAHDPSILDQTPDQDEPQSLNDISLILSGHTHGQKGFGDGIQKTKISELPNPIAHPKKFMRKMPFATLSCRHKYSSGHYIVGDKQLYVDPGVGIGGLSKYLKFGKNQVKIDLAVTNRSEIPPSVTILTLRKGKPKKVD